MSFVARLPMISTYRVEVSGWDSSQSFFVEKSELEWNDEGEKHVALGRELRDGAILFVRLLQPVSPDRSYPVPYQTEQVRRSTGVKQHRWEFRLKQVQPQRNQTEGWRR